MQERRNAGMHPLARKPVKKRSTRKTFTLKIVEAKPLAKAPKFKLRVGSDGDPFFIDKSTVPHGVALQWVVTHVMGEPFPHFVQSAKYDGWKLVPNQVPISGQVLMWASAGLVRSQREAEINRAKDQMNQGRQDLGFNNGTRFPIVSPSFMVSTDYDRVSSDAPPIDVDVVIKVRMDQRLQDAAAALKLPLEVYAQRRIELYIRGDIVGLLLPRSHSALELYEEGNFSFHINNEDTYGRF